MENSVAWLKDVAELWRKQAEIAAAHKERVFGRTARKIWYYFGKEYLHEVDVDDESPVGSESGQPRVRRIINKTREFVDIMRPRVLGVVRQRLVTPSIPELPDFLRMLAPGAGPSQEHHLRAWLMTVVLNYLPDQYGLKQEADLAVTEALAKGRGVIWHETADYGTGFMPASHYDSVDNLLIDPDCKRPRDAAYIMRWREISTWEAKDKWPHLDVDKIRSKDSGVRSHRTEALRRLEKQDAEKSDICGYWEVWSRIGMGQVLAAASGEMKEVATALDAMGNHIWLAIHPTYEYPLNLSPDYFMGDTPDPDEIRKAIAWPVEIPEDHRNPWPCSFLDFIPNCDDPWATACLENCLPIQVFLDQSYEEAFGEMPKGTRQVGVYSKQLNKKIVDLIERGKRYELCDYEGEAVDLSRLLHWIELPRISPDFWTMIQAAEAKFEQASMLNATLYGEAPDRQIRSAAEASSRERNASTRPEEFAKTTDDWLIQIQVKEGQLLRLVVDPKTVAPLFGEPVPDLMSDDGISRAYNESPLTLFWAQLVTTNDPKIAAAELTYQHEQGDVSGITLAKRQENATQLVQMLMPNFLARAQAGDVQPAQQLLGILAEAFAMPLDRIQLAPPMPPMPGGPPMLPAPQDQAAPPPL
ncbi:MAG: hypothetical protein ACOY3P_20140 [Planctomycetota bacterium]